MSEAGGRDRGSSLQAITGLQIGFTAHLDKPGRCPFEEEGFVETVKRVREGAIGEIRSGRCYYNTGSIWHHDRKQGETNLSHDT